MPGLSPLCLAVGKWHAANGKCQTLQQQNHVCLVQARRDDPPVVLSSSWENFAYLTAEHRELAPFFGLAHGLLEFDVNMRVNTTEVAEYLPSLVYSFKQQLNQYGARYQ